MRAELDYKRYRLEDRCLDAEKAYRDLSPFRVHVKFIDDGWHVDYELKNRNSDGGGPHYIIDAQTGAILTKRYEQ